MAKITKRGEALARKLQPWLETAPNWSWFEVAGALSVVARHAASLHWLAEEDCNCGLTDSQAAKRERLEERVRELVAALPHGITVVFNHDPRGPAVKLALPGEWHRLHDCFGGEGVCV